VVVAGANRSLGEARRAVEEQLKSLRPDMLRYINPTPYKVSVSPNLFTFLHELWQTETPVVFCKPTVCLCCLELIS
jgi:nicotinate phosphoribosyltransferase